MDETLARLLALISANAAMAGPIIGLIAFVESLLVVGMLVPAIPLMMAIGGLVATGVLDLSTVLFWAILGAVLGDWVSYLLSIWIGPSIYRRKPLCNHKSAVAQARLFFWRYGFGAVFLGRFFGPVRATIPLVAGVMRMNHRKFQLANVFSAIVWVPAMLAPGYLAGSALPLQNLTGGQISLILLALLIIPFLFSIITAKTALYRRGKSRK